MSKMREAYGALMVVLIWYVLHFLLGANMIPSPLDTVVNLATLLFPVIVPHLGASLLRIIVAIAVSLILGVAIGLLTGASERADRMLSPVNYVLYPIPKVAFLPVIILLFGLGDLSKIVLTVSIIVFPIIMTTRDGVKELGKEFFYAARSLGMDRVQTYRHVIIPAVLPQVITAIRISVGTSIAVLFFGENFATRYGIGYYIMNNWLMVNYLNMFSGILALSLMGYALFKLIDFAESRLCAWVSAGKTDHRSW